MTGYEQKNSITPTATLQPYDPLEGTISAGGSVPAGNYTAVFRGVEHLPIKEADPMTGKGGRQFAAHRYQWEIAEGEHKDKLVSTETSVKNGPQSRGYQVISWLLGQNPTGKYSLKACIGKQYLLTVGCRNGKSWIEVTNAMLIPNQK